MTGIFLAHKLLCNLSKPFGRPLATSFKSNTKHTESMSFVEA